MNKPKENLCKLGQGRVSKNNPTRHMVDGRLDRVRLILIATEYEESIVDNLTRYKT